MMPIERKMLSGISVDFGGSKTAIARIEQGQVVDYRKSVTETAIDGAALVQSLVEQLHKMDLSDKDKVAVAVTGRVDSSGNWYAVNQSTLAQIDQVSLQSLLSRQLARPVAVINDALAGALAEYHFGAGIASTRMAYLTVSTGVGAGIVLDGVPLKSPRGLAGHAGFTSSRFATERCGSGRMATVESVASGTAIAQAATTAGYPMLNAEAVFAAYLSDEPWAVSIIQQSVTAIADLCADLVALLEIDQVVIGGGVGLAAGYSDAVQSVVNSMPALFQVKVVTADMASDSALFGALLNEKNSRDR